MNIIEEHNKLIKLLNTYKHNLVFEIPFNKFEDYHNLKVIGLQCYEIQEIIGIDWNFMMCYNDKKVIFCQRRKLKLKNTFTIQVPYGEREKYIDCLYHIHTLVPDEGLFYLAVNNIPYYLESRVVVETSQNQAKIKEIIKNNNLYIDTTKGFDEIFLEMLERKWNTISFPPNINRQDFSDLFNSQFVFDNIQTIERKGYNLKHNITRKKVFISYCHNDKEIVHSITQQLEDSGANLWIDKKCIDYGDDILESVMTGIKESDLAVLFLSNSTKTQLFARRELKTIYSDVIYDRKKWFIIKLDNVDVDDIIYGLSNFLYYDYTSNENTIDLIREILKRVKTL